MSSQRVKKISNLMLMEVSGVCTASGAEAQFYELGNSKYGIKLYRSFKIAKQSYERQEKAAQKGLAPNVGKMVIAYKKGRMKLHYGYQTEKALSVDEDDTIYKKQKAGLYSKLRKLGLGGDFADANCGILKRKLVAVDFGSHSEATW